MRFLFLTIALFLNTQLWAQDCRYHYRQVLVESVTSDHPIFPNKGSLSLLLDQQRNLKCIEVVSPKDLIKSFISLNLVNAGGNITILRNGIDVANISLPYDQSPIYPSLGGRLILKVRKNIFEWFHFPLSLERSVNGWEAFLDSNQKHKFKSIFIDADGLLTVKKVKFY